MLNNIVFIFIFILFSICSETIIVIIEYHSPIRNYECVTFWHKSQQIKKRRNCLTQNCQLLIFVYSHFQCHLLIFGPKIGVFVTAKLICREIDYKWLQIHASSYDKLTRFLSVRIFTRWTLWKLLII